jgi:alginate O-acetyltransferase complex protein AlgI
MPGTISKSTLDMPVLTPAARPSPSAAPSHAESARDPREKHAAPRLRGFLTLMAQLLGLLFVFHQYHLEKPEFVLMSVGIVAAFAVHYWLPFRFKELFWVAVSILGSFWVVESRVAALVIAFGLLFFLILRSPVSYRLRVLLLTAIFAVLAYGCATRRLHLPVAFYPVFGAIFMFRLIGYVYDFAHAKAPPRLLPFLSYFFLLPNFSFLLFPVIDFPTMRRTYYQRDIHQIAQQGIHWITRGAIQLMLYRLVLYLNDSYLPDRVNSLSALVATIVLTFLLYLNVSGTFHLIIGFLHLFGYDLPETHRRYYLASSFLDFWRRINIYWKDFMVKIVYFPVYFKLRRKGEARAQVIATVAVFLVTWALHSYQLFWLQGKFTLTWPDTIFWGGIGILVVANTLYDFRHPRRRSDLSCTGRAVHAAKVMGTFAVIATLWSLWSSPTLTSWIYLVTHWAHHA